MAKFDFFVILPFALLQCGLMLIYLWRRPALRRFLSASPLTIGLFAFATLALSVVLFLALDPFRGSLFFFSFILALGVLCSVGHPVTALSYLISLIIMRPWEFYPDNEILKSLPKSAAILALIVWGMSLIVTPNARIRISKLTIVFFCFIGWLFISAIGSGNFDTSFLSVKEYFTAIAVIFFLMENALRDREDLQLVVRSIALSIAAIICAAMYGTYIEGRPPSVPGVIRLEGVGQMGNSNDLGALIAFMLPFVGGYFLSKKNALPLRFMGLVLLAISLTGLILTQSRATLLAVALMLAVSFWLNVRQIWIKLPLVVIALVLPLLMQLVISRDESDLEDSKSSRINMVFVGMRMVKSSPLFGVGVDNFPRLYERYTSDFTVYGEKTAHSSWILALAETGPMGLLIFFYFMIVGLFVPAWKLRKNDSAFFLATIGYGIAMTFLSHTYLLYPYLLAGLVSAARRSQAASQTRSAPSVTVLR